MNLNHHLDHGRRRLARGRHRLPRSRRRLARSRHPPARFPPTRLPAAAPGRPRLAPTAGPPRHNPALPYAGIAAPPPDCRRFHPGVRIHPPP